jgi:hypothetical protein
LDHDTESIIAVVESEFTALLILGVRAKMGFEAISYKMLNEGNG